MIFSYFCSKHERISTDERSIVNTHSIDVTSKFAVSIKEKQDRLPTLYWLPKRHKRPIKHVSLLILVHVRLLFCPNCKLHALLLLKTFD